jgi:hypothetical protein
MNSGNEYARVSPGATSAPDAQSGLGVTTAGSEVTIKAWKQKAGERCAVGNALVAAHEPHCPVCPEPTNKIVPRRKMVPSSMAVQPQPFPHQVGGHGALALHGAGLVKKPLVERELAFYEYVWGDLVDIFERLDDTSEDGLNLRRKLVAPHSPRKLERLLSSETRGRALANLRDRLQYRRMKAERRCALCRQNAPVGCGSSAGTNKLCTMQFSDLVVQTLREFTARYYGIVSLYRVRGEWRYTRELPSSSAIELEANDSSDSAITGLPDAAERRSPASSEDTSSGLVELWHAENGKALDVNPWARVCFERSFAAYASHRGTRSPRVGTTPGADANHMDPDRGVVVETGVTSSDPDDAVQHDFLVLEDLTFPFRYPSVLDVKVGTRDYDDEATEEKRRRHIEKCRMTTSARYGVRLTGMQVFQPERRTYLCHDKYHGRRLKDEEQLQEELQQYLDNGQRSRVAALRAVQVANAFRQRLEKLRDFVARQEEWRFYSSSLLFIYEGDSVEAQDAPVPPASDANAATASEVASACAARNGSKSGNATSVCLKMIDFAHTQRSNCDDGPNDDGYLLGIETMIRLFFNAAQRFAERGNQWHP